MTQDQLRALIADAFSGVTLPDSSISLIQAEEATMGKDGPTRQQLTEWRKAECINNWQRVEFRQPEESMAIVHFDAFAFRYYIPVYMWKGIDQLDPQSLTMTFVFAELCPDSKAKQFFDFTVRKYSALTIAQKKVVAQFLLWSRENLDVSEDDREMIGQALEGYWREYADVNNPS